jgi:hypothetical protein
VPVAPVTAERNIFGHRPWQIAYLRLFENEPRVRQFLDGPWRACGYVHLIRSARSVSRAELREADRQRLFIDSRERLQAELRAQPVAPLPRGRHVLATIAGRKVKVRDRLGSYPVRSLLCHDNFWKTAVDVLLTQVDVVLLDLSGFRRENTGTGWELQRLIDRFRIDRVLLLADPSSDREFLQTQIRHAWSQMADGSPNAGEAPRSVHVAVIGSNASDVHNSLFTLVRGYSLGLAVWLQNRLAGAA